MVTKIRPIIVVLVLACIGLVIALLQGNNTTAAPMPLAPAQLQGMLTFRDDIASTGSNTHETKLSPAIVRTGNFGKLFATPVDGQIYAQPLVAAGVTITKGVNTKPGAEGVHLVAFAATEKDSLYAIDGAEGKILWQRAFADTENAGGNQNNTSNATAITPLSNDEVRSGDINPSIGITGTPVIDGATSTMYVLAKTRETIGGQTHYVQRLHAINLSDGTDRVAPYVIGDTSADNNNNTSIFVFGTGDGSVNDARNGTGKRVVEFNALKEHHRGAINLVNGKVYVQWASHGDNGPYHGWVVCWDISHIATTGFKVVGALNVSPNSGAAGIWEASGRLAFEPDGSAFYFETGNGTGPAPTLNADGFPSNAGYNEALVKVVADPSTTPANQNPNGWGLKVADYFIPYNVLDLDHGDADFGSGGCVLLPDSAGIPGHPHLLVGGGKDGKLMVFDRDHLGHYDPAGDHVLNAVNNGRQNTAPKLVNGLLSTPAWFNGKVYACGNYGGSICEFRVEQNGTLNKTSQTESNMGGLSGSPSVSSNGATNGIVWMIARGGDNELRAFDADTLSTEFWNSNQGAGGQGADDRLDGGAVKFTGPTIYDGRVYVGTSNNLDVYGVKEPPNAPPVAPVLTATPLWSSSINLTWADASKFPNISGNYAIEQSTDNVHFTPVVDKVPARASSLAVGKLEKLTKYYFRIQGINAVGKSPYSNVATATTTNQSPTANFPNGFTDAGNMLKLNNSAKINNKNLRLVDGNNQAGSAYFADPVDITSFSCHFTFKLSKGDSANGFTFVLQNSGPNALGRNAGGLGYGGDNSGQGGIKQSVAVKFDLFNTHGEGPSSTGLYTDGAQPTDAGSVDLRTSEINLHSGDIFDVTLEYDGTNLTATIKDTQTGQTATNTYPIDIAKTVGDSTAYAGFTGGTGRQGRLTADILQWTLTHSGGGSGPGAATVSPNAPTGLGAVPASGTSIKLNWTSNAPNQAGYRMERAADAAFTKNVVKKNIPKQPNTYVDTAAGLTPGMTYYYRIRAYNAVGDSDNSNVASVTIPQVAPKPTKEKVDSVTASEVDISWQDNAGHQTDGYKIMRATNHGLFTVVADLPATSRPAPSPYSWTDHEVAPGTTYEYRIQPHNVSGDNDFVTVVATTPAQ